MPRRGQLAIFNFGTDRQNPGGRRARLGRGDSQRWCARLHFFVVPQPLIKVHIFLTLATITAVQKTFDIARNVFY
jgi:hypothetical protein